MERRLDRVHFRNFGRRSSGFVCLILVVEGCWLRWFVDVVFFLIFIVVVVVALNRGLFNICCFLFWGQELRFGPERYKM